MPALGLPETFRTPGSSFRVDSHRTRWSFHAKGRRFETARFAALLRFSFRPVSSRFVSSARPVAPNQSIPAVVAYRFNGTFRESRSATRFLLFVLRLTRDEAISRWVVPREMIRSDFAASLAVDTGFVHIKASGDVFDDFSRGFGHGIFLRPQHRVASSSNDDARQASSSRGEGLTLATLRLQSVLRIPDRADSSRLSKSWDRPREYDNTPLYLGLRPDGA